MVPALNSADKTSHKINTANKNAVLKRLTAHLPFSKSGGKDYIEITDLPPCARYSI